ARAVVNCPVLDNDVEIRCASRRRKVLRNENGRNGQCEDSCEKEPAIHCAIEEALRNEVNAKFVAAVLWPLGRDREGTLTSAFQGNESSFELRGGFRIFLDYYFQRHRCFTLQGE